MMKKFSLVFVLMLFSGCATSSIQTGPTYMDWETGKKKFDAKVVFADTSLFAPSSSDTLMLECLSPETVVTKDLYTGETHFPSNDLENEELLAESRCRGQNVIAHDTTTGAAASFVAPVLRSAAIAYGAHEIGKGIGKSKDCCNKFEALAKMITILGNLPEFDGKWVIKQISFLNKGVVDKN